ncbi:ABC transporter substrate-binding protein [Kineococcus arenarius]|uniref:ABC transporter substrate-binding protein n=1 Tax=Kineococcus sp. SYSU DK007 TaxID=3383128 RepID=UPI003D7C842C
MQRRHLLTLALLAAATPTVAGCGGSDPLAAGNSSSGSTNGSAGSGSDVISVGSANFPESELLAEMYAQVLEAAGVKVERHFGIGSREVYMRALQDGSIDLIPEYNGALLAYLADNDAVDASTAEAVHAGLQEKLPATLTLLDEATAEDKDSLVVTAATAQRYDLATIADLAPVAGDFVLGAGAEYAERRQGLLGLAEVYDVTFEQFRPLDAGGPLTVAALEDDTVQVASLLSTDPVIAKKGFVTLQDPQGLFGVQNVVPLISTAKNTATVTQALNAFSATLTTDALSAALGRVSLEREDSATVARDYLTDHGLI